MTAVHADALARYPRRIVAQEKRNDASYVARTSHAGNGHSPLVLLYHGLV
jgi:hypothetical protein